MSIPLHPVTLWSCLDKWRAADRQGQEGSIQVLFKISCMYRKHRLAIAKRLGEPGPTATVVYNICLDTNNPHGWKSSPYVLSSAPYYALLYYIIILIYIIPYYMIYSLAWLQAQASESLQWILGCFLRHGASRDVCGVSVEKRLGLRVQVLRSSSRKGTCMQCVCRYTFRA